MLAELLLTGMRAARIGAAPPCLSVRQALLDNLVFVHQMIVASGPLLLEAIETLRQRGAIANSDFDVELLGYYDKHWWEENQHADWLANDLAQTGIDVRGQPLSVDAVEATGAQYYLIRHAHPCALLGYMAFLECFPTSMTTIEQLELIHGADLLRTMRHHAEHDPDHGEDVLALIDRVPEQWQAVVYNNGVRTAQRFVAAASTFGKGEQQWHQAR